MARIYAKFNSGSEAWDPVDPDKWLGGVVPGPGDIAQFHRYKQTGGNNTYENNYNYMSMTYNAYDSNHQNNGYIHPNAHVDATGSYRHDFWTGDYLRNFIGHHMSGSPELTGTQMTYGATGDGAYYHGYYMQYHQHELTHQKDSLCCLKKKKELP